MFNTRRKIQLKAETIRGLVRVLHDDAIYIYADAKDFDIVGLDRSIGEAKETLQVITDSIAELEYSLYLLKENFKIGRE